ncbi:MAG: hypothetical protein IKP52_00280 [Prevotella sp.]|nr:hypothetical protein [Prevotella sp.]
MYTKEEKVKEYVEQNVVSQAENYLICQAIIKYVESDVQKVFTNRINYYAENPYYDFTYYEKELSRLYIGFASASGAIKKLFDERWNEIGNLYVMLSNEGNIEYQMHQIDSTLTFQDLIKETSLYSTEEIADIYFKPDHLKFTEITPELYRSIYRSMLCLGAKAYKYDIVDDIRIKEKEENKWTVDLVYHSGYCMPLEIGYDKENGFFVSEAPWLPEAWGEEDDLGQELNIDDVDEVVEIQRLLENSKYQKYTNARFGFSFSYPDCFEMGKESENGDGREFLLKYGISFVVSGGYNVYDKNIKDYYQNDEDRRKASYHVQKGNWYVLSGYLDNDTIYYKKVVWMKNAHDEEVYVKFYLKYPKKFEDVLKDFINYEAKNFKSK